MLECSPLNDGRVAQRQSSGLLSHWFRVRISARSQPPPEKQGFFHGKMNEPNLRYANHDSTLRPDWTIVDGENTLFWDGMDEEIKN